MSDPIFPLRQWPSGIQQASVPANDNALREEAVKRPALGVANDASGSDADGDMWIVGDTPAGAFATFEENDVALYQFGSWYAWAPTDGLRLIVNDVPKIYVGGSTNEWQDDTSDGIPDAPSDGSTYGRKDGAWEVVAGTGDVTGPASSTDGNLAVFDGTTGKILKDGGAPLTNPMTTAGDIITGGTSGAVQRLGIGSDGQVLKVVSGAVNWADESGGGGSGDVVGPASSVDSHVALFDGVTGKLLKDGGALGGMAGINDAPSDGTGYVRKDGAWVAESGGGGGATSYTIVTEATAFTADPGTHDGLDRYIRAGGNVTFDSAEPYTAGMAFNIRATGAVTLVGTGVTLTAPSGGTLGLTAGMAVQVVMTSATTADVIGQTVVA